MAQKYTNHGKVLTAALDDTCGVDTLKQRKPAFTRRDTRMEKE